MILGSPKKKGGLNMFERSIDLESWESVPRHKVEYAIKRVFGEGGVCFGMQMIEQGMVFSAGDFHFRCQSQGEAAEAGFESMGVILSRLGLERFSWGEVETE